jgi:putative ABC transport system permease protein
MRLHGIALRNLHRRKASVAFLVAALLAGVATVVTLITLSAALEVRAQNNLENFGANIVVRPQVDDVALGYGGMDLGAVPVDAGEIREADLARIDTIPNRKNIAIVAPQLLGVVEARGSQVLLMGVRPQEQFALKQWWSVDGRPPADGAELVAGAAAAEALGLKKGDTLDIRGSQFTVTGVLEPTGSEDDGLLIAPLPTVQRLLGRPGAVSMVEIAALCHDCPVEEIVRQLSVALPGTQPLALQQVMENRMHALDRFRQFSYLIAGVIIAVEALVVFVIMMGSVNGRTRELGVFRALGFRRAHVSALVLMEAVVVSLLAGVLGYLAGMALSHALLPLLGGQGVAIDWTPYLAGGAVGLAVLIAAAASLYPAARASRMDPTVALRSI